MFPLGGAEVSVGVTLFRGEDGRDSGDALLQVAAGISWGFVVPRHRGPDAPPRGFLSHNVGFRAATFRRHAYRTDLGFSLGWWVRTLHRRFGYEVVRLRRLDGARHGWLVRAGWLEPPMTALWHVACDVPQWWRFARVAGVPVGRRTLLLPLVVPMSALARGSEMFGMLRTITSPAEMKRFAESS